MAVSIPRERIAINLDAVRRRMAAAAERAGHPPETVQLVAVTKTVGLDEVHALCDLGIQHLGENRLQAAQPKIAALDRDVLWHMIGPVQRRKAKEVVNLFQCVDAVDRIEVAEALNKRCDEQGTRMDVLLEVNVSGEQQKHGFRPDELELALDSMRKLDSLRVQGLMTMAPYVEDPEKTRPVFAGLRRIAQQFGLTELSMGMTNDFEIAIEEGATQVRIGSALFQ